MQQCQAPSGKIEFKLLHAFTSTVLCLKYEYRIKIASKKVPVNRYYALTFFNLHARRKSEKRTPINNHGKEAPLVLLNFDPPITDIFFILYCIMHAYSANKVLSMPTSSISIKKYFGSLCNQERGGGHFWSPPHSTLSSPVKHLSE